MKHKYIRLALVSAEPDCLNAIGNLCTQHDWRFLANVDHTQPLLWLQRQRVDVALVDLDYPDALMIILDMVRFHSELPVIAVAQPGQFLDLQQVLQAGAAGFVAKPIAEQPFVTAMTKIVAKKAAEEGEYNQHRGRIIVVTSLTGGVGKSTIAVNLALAMQQQHATGVILAEMHSGLSVAAMMLNLHPDLDLSSFVHALDVDRDIVRRVMTEHSSGMRLLAGAPSISSMVDFEAKEWRVILSALAECGSTKVLDTAPIADGALTEILNLADVALVVARPDVPSVRHAVDLINVIRASDTSKAVPHLVLNRTGMLGALNEKIVRGLLGDEKFVSIPDDVSLTSWALNRGVPFILSNPSARISDSIINLAQSLLPRTSEDDALSIRYKSSNRTRPTLLSRLNFQT